jgi:hypothetical protein
LGRAGRVTDEGRGRRRNRRKEGKRSKKKGAKEKAIPQREWNRPFHIPPLLSVSNSRWASTL